jgi:hypothetical protein
MRPVRLSRIAARATLRRMCGSIQRASMAAEGQDGRRGKRI